MATAADNMATAADNMATSADNRAAPAAPSAGQKYKYSGQGRPDSLGPGDAGALGVLASSYMFCWCMSVMFGALKVPWLYCRNSERLFPSHQTPLIPRVDTLTLHLGLNELMKAELFIFWQWRPSKSATRITYGVDHDSYAYQLALDMQTAPSFTEIMQLAWKMPRRWWRLPLVWALGVNFNTKFRLRGPWQWDGAVEVLTGELWATVSRRNLLFGAKIGFTWLINLVLILNVIGHITLSLIPMLIFGPMSLAVWCFSGLLSVLGPGGK